MKNFSWDLSHLNELTQRLSESSLFSFRRLTKIPNPFCITVKSFVSTIANNPPPPKKKKKAQARVVYLCKKLRISCLATPSSSHAFSISTFTFSTLLLSSSPFSLRHRSMVCFISIPTAWRHVPSGSSGALAAAAAAAAASSSPFLATGPLRPCPVLTWKSSKATLRFSVTCAAATGWSKLKGQQILYTHKKKKKLIHKSELKKKKDLSGLQGDTARQRFSNTIKTSMRKKPSSCLQKCYHSKYFFKKKHSASNQVSSSSRDIDNTGWFKMNCCGHHVVSIPRPDDLIFSACCSDTLARGDA